MGEQPSLEAVELACTSLSAGGIVAGPTDTVYGIFAAADNEQALSRVFAVKGRSTDKPLPVLVDGMGSARAVARFSDAALALARAFWPGPLTLILPAQMQLSKLVVRNGNIAVRWPDSRFAVLLAESLGGYVAATSANPSGVTATSSGARARLFVGDAVDVLVDGGESGTGLASTVVDMSGDEPLVLREGAIKAADVRKALEKLKIIIGADHAGYELKDGLAEHLRDHGYQVKDVGTGNGDSVDYPDYAADVARAVSGGEYSAGILVCGSGVGMAIVANKFVGVRAAVCNDSECARLSRAHNDANVLSIGARMVDPAKAIEIVDTWLSTEFEGGRHQRRLDKISSMEKKED